MKILIIDDSFMDRKLIASMLKRNGIANDVLEAADGEEGMSVLSSNFEDVGIILLDWQMPKMDGIEFMNAVKKVPATAQIPIIMVTASGSDECKKQAKTVNPDLAGYVVKPYKPQILCELVTQVLNRDLA